MFLANNKYKKPKICFGNGLSLWEVESKDNHLKHGKIKIGQEIHP